MVSSQQKHLELLSLVSHDLILLLPQCHFMIESCGPLTSKRLDGNQPGDFMISGVSVHRTRDST
jgi:hypothetical protein